MIEKRPAPKKRKKKFNRNFLIYIAIILGVAMLFSAWIITSVNEVLALMRPDKEIIVEIPPNATAGDVAEILDDCDVINHEYLFRFFTFLTENDAEFSPGQYKLNSNMDYRAMLRRLTSKKAALKTVKVTIPEGYEIRQIVSILVENKVCEKEELEEVLANAEFEYSFLKDTKFGDINRLEGYLFPDTYEFYIGDTPERVIEKFLKNFDSKYTEDMEKRAKELGFTTHELITLASIIEREATEVDRKNISSVFHNRLGDSTYPYLESCATVQYILGERKKVISIEDTKIDNKYNTYKYKGLPPGPISNPGFDAIEAALYPNDTNYYFFALQNDGTHKFSKTYEEHLKTPKLNP